MRSRVGTGSGTDLPPLLAAFVRAHVDRGVIEVRQASLRALCAGKIIGRQLSVVGDEVREAALVRNASEPLRLLPVIERVGHGDSPEKSLRLDIIE